MSQATDLIDLAIGQLNQARTLLTTTVPTVRAGESIQAAVDKIAAGGVIIIEPGVYQENVLIPKSLKLVSSVELPQTRALSKSPVTIFGNGPSLRVTGNDVIISSIGVQSNDPTSQLVELTGARIALDRMSIMGNADNGAHRGVAMNGDTQTLTKCYIDECWNVGRDAQAVAGWDGSRNIVIDDCYLSGGAETVMFGGADSTSPDRVPTNVVMRNSLLTKNLVNWLAKKAQIKNCLELKCVKGFSMINCVMEYAGMSAGQAGYLIALTVRNQDGKAPWSNIEDVFIHDCVARHGAGCVNILGSDNNQTSGLMSNVVVQNVLFTDIDATKNYGNANRGFLFQRGGKNITLKDLTIETNPGSDLSALGYFVPPAPTGLTLQNIKVPNSKYGWKIDNAGGGVAALRAWSPGSVIALTASDTGATIQEVK